MADAQDLGSCGQPWGFKSLHPHQKTQKKIPIAVFTDGQLPHSHVQSTLVRGSTRRALLSGLFLCFLLIYNKKKARNTLFLPSQDMDFIQKKCTAFLPLSHGKIANEERFSFGREKGAKTNIMQNFCETFAKVCRECSFCPKPRLSCFLVIFYL